MLSLSTPCTLFVGDRQAAAGPLAEVAAAAKTAHDRAPDGLIQVFEDETGQTIDIDYRGGPQDVARRLAERVQAPAPAAKGPGRPKLGVVAREVTLLPRHWEWLSDQPGGASVALRKLVEEARRSGPARTRQVQAAVYRFISAMAGNAPGFEEANRALFAGDGPGFDRHSRDWPADVRAHARRLAAPLFEQAEAG